MFENKDKEKDIVHIKFLFDITTDSYNNQYLDNTFIIFQSKNSNILYLIYSSNNQTIISYNLNSFSIINKIKKAHNKDIINFSHHYSKEEKKDLVMNISFNNNIKIWDIVQFNCIINLNNININGGILSACFLIDSDNNYILTSNYFNNLNNEPLKIFKFNGEKVKSISDSNEITYLVDTYYDIKQSKLYIISGFESCIKSYDYSKNKLYHKYYQNLNFRHCSIVIYSYNDIIRMIDSCCSGEGFIRIWNFHSATLLKIININCSSMGINLWNNKYLFVGCIDKSIKLIELTQGIIINKYKEHKNWICTLKVIKHPQLGDCLVSHARVNDNIKIWKIENNIDKDIYLI